MWFHRALRADEWLLLDHESPAAAGARAFSTARVFTRDGRLVASVVQEGLVRPRPRQG
jgi:acyl-CoA thioesterase-2